MCWYTEEMTMLLTEGAEMLKRVMASFTVLAVLVAGLVGCQERTSQGGGKLVHSGVQSVTICDEHHVRIFDRIAEKIPGSDEGVWGPKREGGCHTWYHYTASGAD
jgi:hypothetical protein